MKKLLAIAVMLFGLNSFAQKTFEVYNYSSQTIYLHDIVTNSGGSFPEFRTKPVVITVAPGASFTLQNPANVYRFPFNGSSSISQWYRMEASGTGTYVPSNVAWIAGNSQVFTRMNYTVGSPSMNMYVISTTDTYISGSGVEAIYDQFQDPNNPNMIFYTIAFF